MHAIAFIGHVRGSIEDYVDDCYSVQKFRAAYEHIIPGLVDKSQWPKGDHGFFLEPPILKSVAGRRRKNRTKDPKKGPKGLTNAQSVNDMGTIGTVIEKAILNKKQLCFLKGGHQRRGERRRVA